MRSLNTLVAAGLGLFVGVASCTDEAGDEPHDATAGAAGDSVNEAIAGSGEPAGAGAGGQGRGSGGGAGGGGGNSAGEGGAGDATACRLENQCGGCGPPTIFVKCSWGEVRLPEEVELAARCSEAERLFAGEGGAGGGSNRTETLGDGGTGGAADPGLCATYVAPGLTIHDCDPCTETTEVEKRGECIVRDECCVIVESFYCGI